MCFDVRVLTFGDETLAGLRHEVATLEESVRRAAARLANCEAELAAAMAREEAQRQRADRAASESGDLGNAHVGQKDRLLQLCNEGEYERVLELLAFVEQSWRAVGYGYKAGEIKQRVRGDAKHDLDGLNPRQRREHRRLGEVLARVG